MVVTASATSNFVPPAEGIILQQPSIKLFVDDHDVGTGTLYVTHNAVVWGGSGSGSSSSSASSVTLPYRSIGLHGVQAQPTPALYMQVSHEIRVPQQFNLSSGGGGGDAGDAGDAGADAMEEGEDEDFDPEDSAPRDTELRWVPLSGVPEQQLQALFEALNQGQALHPDPDTHSDSDGEPYLDGEDHNEEEWAEAEGGEGEGEGEAAARLAHLRLHPHNGSEHDDTGDPEQFADN